MVNTPGKVGLYKAEKGRRDNIDNQAFFDFCKAGEKGLFADRGVNAYSSNSATNQKILALYGLELIDVQYDGCIDVEGQGRELEI